MILDLSKYKTAVTEVDAAELAKANAEYVSRFSPGTHECTIVGFHKLTPVGGGEPADMVFNAKDPNWVQFMPIYQNAAGEQEKLIVMVPVAGHVMFNATAESKGTGLVYRNLNTFVAALGFEPEVEGIEASLWFAKCIVETGGACINKLIGAQLKIQTKWREDALHPWFNKDDRNFYLVNCEGGLVEGFAEPIVIEPTLKGEERWAEMKLMCDRATTPFVSQPDHKLAIHDTVKNDLSAFLPKQAKAAAQVFKPKTTNIATKPPMVQAAILEDATPPV